MKSLSNGWAFLFYSLEGEKDMSTTKTKAEEFLEKRREAAEIG